jgi:hypothetical protein
LALFSLSSSLFSEEGEVEEDVDSSIMAGDGVEVRVEDLEGEEDSAAEVEVSEAGDLQEAGNIRKLLIFALMF